MRARSPDTSGGRRRGRRRPDLIEVMQPPAVPRHGRRVPAEQLADPALLAEQTRSHHRVPVAVLAAHRGGHPWRGRTGPASTATSANASYAVAEGRPRATMPVCALALLIARSKKRRGLDRGVVVAGSLAGHPVVLPCRLVVARAVEVQRQQAEPGAVGFTVAGRAPADAEVKLAPEAERQTRIGDAAHEVVSEAQLALVDHDEVVEPVPRLRAAGTRHPTCGRRASARNGRRAPRRGAARLRSAGDRRSMRAPMRSSSEPGMSSSEPSSRRACASSSRKSGLPIRAGAQLQRARCAECRRRR